MILNGVTKGGIAALRVRKGANVGVDNGVFPIGSDGSHGFLHAIHRSSIKSGQDGHHRIIISH